MAKPLSSTFNVLCNQLLYSPHTYEGELEALVTISSKLRALIPINSLSDPKAWDLVAEAWDALATPHHNEALVDYAIFYRNGTDISVALAQSLAKHAASILKVLLHPDHPRLLPGVAHCVGTGLRRLGSTIERLTYAELLRSQDSISQDQEDETNRTFESEVGARLWMNALEANALEA
ncbi:hypothetical protein HGRIS_014569 [Hohenbuehelia grisea]|uniref:Uncharacterized protein n=1 Tax=Hohenbuehelia grisea TaxID=104357 RepID=A0ABR3JVU4_9AGAR